MKKFIYQILIFLSPFASVLIIIILFLFHTGEFFTPLNKLILSGEDYLIGHHHQKNYSPIKWKELTLNKRRKVWILGTSRVMSFRQEMFETSFYNANDVAKFKIISDYLDFLKNIPKEKYPEVIILGLDQNMFQTAQQDVLLYDSKKLDWSYQQFFPDSNYLRAFVYKIIYEYDLSVIINHLLKQNNKNRIGLAAVLENTGYRKDGSWNFNREVKRVLKFDEQKLKFSQDIYRINNGGYRFGFSDEVNLKSVFELKNLVEYCDKNNINVVAMINPFPKSINEEIMKNGKHAYMNKIFPTVKQIINNANLEIWDINNLTNYNMNDDEFIDGLHGIEVVAIKTLLCMIDNNSLLKDFVNKNKIIKKLRKSRNNYLVY